MIKIDPIEAKIYIELEAERRLLPDLVRKFDKNGRHKSFNMLARMVVDGKIKHYREFRIYSEPIILDGSTPLRIEHDLIKYEIVAENSPMLDYFVMVDHAELEIILANLKASTGDERRDYFIDNYLHLFEEEILKSMEVLRS